MKSTMAKLMDMVKTLESTDMGLLRQLRDSDDR